MYSCIAGTSEKGGQSKNGNLHKKIGFLEAAESLEEAIRREAYEETGIIVNRVAYHSSQPWV